MLQHTTLRLEQVEWPLVRKTNWHLTGVTKWTGTMNSKYNGCIGVEIFAPGFAEPLPLMGLLLNDTAEWRRVEVIESHELDVANMDHNVLYGNAQDCGPWSS